MILFTYVIYTTVKIYLIYYYKDCIYIVNYLTQTESRHHTIFRLTVSDSMLGMKTL